MLFFANLQLNYFKLGYLCSEASGFKKLGQLLELVAVKVIPYLSFQVPHLLPVVSLQDLDLLPQMSQQCSLGTAVGQHEVDGEAKQSGDGILDACLAQK